MVFNCTSLEVTVTVDFCSKITSKTSSIFFHTSSRCKISTTILFFMCHQKTLFFKVCDNFFMCVQTISSLISKSCKINKKIFLLRVYSLNANDYYVRNQSKSKCDTLNVGNMFMKLIIPLHFNLRSV